MGEWYFKLVLENPNLTDNQCLEFCDGARSNEERGYFEKILMG